MDPLVPVFRITKSQADYHFEEAAGWLRIMTEIIQIPTSRTLRPRQQESLFLPNYSFIAPPPPSPRESVKHFKGHIYDVLAATRTHVEKSKQAVKYKALGSCVLTNLPMTYVPLSEAKHNSRKNDSRTGFAYLLFENRRRVSSVCRELQRFEASIRRKLLLLDFALFLVETMPPGFTFRSHSRREDALLHQLMQESQPLVTRIKRGPKGWLWAVLEAERE